MTAATTDRNTTQRGGHTRYLTLATAAILFAGCMVCRDDAGDAIDAEPDADIQFAGIAREGVDEADGDEGVNVFVEGEFLLAGSGWAAGDEGKDAFLLDNQTVVPATNGTLTHWVRVGKVVEVVSATSVWVRIEPEVRAAPQVFTGVVAGVNAAALDLTDLAAQYGGADIYVLDVLSVLAVVTSTKAMATQALKVVTTNYTVAAGAITTVGDESANTWLITLTGVLQ